MIPVPSGTRVWLAAGHTDMMGWTPPSTQRQNIAAIRREKNDDDHGHWR